MARKLSDDELVDRLKQCVTRDRRWTARMLVHLGEVDARKLYREQGFSSMFDYAVRALNMSEAEAGLRITAARCGREHPQAIELLSRGQLHMSAICVFSSVLTTENVSLLEQARFMSKKQVQELVAMRFPKPDVPTLFRISKTSSTARPSHATQMRARDSMVGSKQRAQVGHPSRTTGKVAARECAEHAAPPSVGPDSMVNPSSADMKITPQDDKREQERGIATPAAAFRLEPPVSAVTMVPLSEGRTLIRFTASRRLGEMLKQAQHLTRHQIPTGDPLAIIERALEMLISDRKKKLFGQVDKPRRTTRKASIAAKRSRYIPRAVRREVADRDDEQCTFIAPDGRRCEERGRLELDHHPTAYARGGASTPDNLRLLCAAHNALAAERTFGRAFMNNKIAEAQSPTHSAPSFHEPASNTDGPALSGNAGDPHGPESPDRPLEVVLARTINSTTATCSLAGSAATSGKIAVNRVELRRIPTEQSAGVAAATNGDASARRDELDRNLATTT